MMNDFHFPNAFLAFLIGGTLFPVYLFLISNKLKINKLNKSLRKMTSITSILSQFLLLIEALIHSYF